MDYDYGFLKDQTYREFNLRRLVNDSWLISVHPITGDTYTPFVAFTTADDLVAALGHLVGKKPAPFRDTSALIAAGGDLANAVIGPILGAELSDCARAALKKYQQEWYAALSAFVCNKPGEA